VLPGSLHCGRDDIKGTGVHGRGGWDDMAGWGRRLCRSSLAESGQAPPRPPKAELPHGPMGQLEVICGDVKPKR
jgi:hypothetical protein